MDLIEIIRDIMRTLYIIRALEAQNSKIIMYAE